MFGPYSDARLSRLYTRAFAQRLHRKWAPPTKASDSQDCLLCSGCAQIMRAVPSTESGGQADHQLPPPSPPSPFFPSTQKEANQASTQLLGEGH